MPSELNQEEKKYMISLVREIVLKTEHQTHWNRVDWLPGLRMEWVQMIKQGKETVIIWISSGI